jgi:23S rRNA (guanosine2251-2'-O)-methyltransferase
MQKLANEAMERKTVEACIAADKIPVIAVLENVRSAYNVGSVFRTADAFLLAGVYCIGYTAYPPNPKLDKTALGSTETVPWLHFNDAASCIQHLKTINYNVFAAEQVATPNYIHKVNFTNANTAIIFGNEVTGVEQDTINLCDGCIEIPQLGLKHSINIANAASIILWEAVKPYLK